MGSVHPGRPILRLVGAGFGGSLGFGVSLGSSIVWMPVAQVGKRKSEQGKMIWHANDYSEESWFLFSRGVAIKVAMYNRPCNREAGAGEGAGARAGRGGAGAGEEQEKEEQEQEQQQVDREKKRRGEAESVNHQLEQQVQQQWQQQEEKVGSASASVRCSASGTCR